MSTSTVIIPIIHSTGASVKLEQSMQEWQITIAAIHERYPGVFKENTLFINEYIKIAEQLAESIRDNERDLTELNNRDEDDACLLTPTQITKKKAQLKTLVQPSMH
jgi:ABC-type xylose transport system substrate-binding protein